MQSANFALFLTLFCIGVSAQSSYFASQSMCNECSRRLAEARLSQNELKQAHTELIKRTILERLGLKEPPTPKLPALSSKYLQQSLNDIGGPVYKEKAEKVEDVIVVFPDDQSLTCPSFSSCFSYSLPKNITTITSAHLWFSCPHSYTVYDLTYWKGHLLRRQPLPGLRSKKSMKWNVIDVKDVVSHWIIKNVLSYGIEISCDPWSNNVANEVSPHQPFLVLKVDASKSASRQKRNIDCSAEVTTCCRESFYLSFKEIGWDDWIIRPDGYMANFCRGSCISDVSISRYHHTTVVQRFIQSQGQSNSTTVPLSLCCTASRMSAISLIYVDEDGFVFQKSLPNMVVEACECA